MTTGSRRSPRSAPLTEAALTWCLKHMYDNLWSGRGLQEMRTRITQGPPRIDYTNAKVKPAWSGARPVEIPPRPWFRRYAVNRKCFSLRI